MENRARSNPQGSRAAVRLEQIETSFCLFCTDAEKSAPENVCKANKTDRQAGILTQECSRKAGMDKFLFAVMAGMSQVRRQSVYSMGEVRA